MQDGLSLEQLAQRALVLPPSAAELDQPYGSHLLGLTTPRTARMQLNHCLGLLERYPGALDNALAAFTAEMEDSRPFHPALRRLGALEEPEMPIMGSLALNPMPAAASAPP